MTKRQARQLAVVLHDLAWLLPRTLSAQANDEGLPLSELEVMRLLVRRPGLSVGEVAADLGLQASNVSAAIRALSARGLLERRRDDCDARVTRLQPTAAAMHSRDRREAAWGDALARVVSALSDEQARRLADAAPALRALVERLSDGR
jgi:DNA-binding MarR family transcriptional regulator